MADRLQRASVAASNVNRRSVGYDENLSLKQLTREVSLMCGESPDRHLHVRDSSLVNNILIYWSDL